MNSKERVLTTLSHSEPDRVPVNYAANQGIDQRLKKHFGLHQKDDEGLRQALGVDFRHIHADYIGPKRYADIPERGVNVDEFGIHRRWIEHDTGGYWDYCDFPLQDADEQTVREWAIPSVDDYDFSQIAEKCKSMASYCVVTGGAGLPDIINSMGMIRTMEQTLVDLAIDEPAGLLYIDRRIELLLEVTERTLEASKGGIDLLWMGEDLGTQIGPMISLELFRKHIRPRHQRFIDLAASFGIPVMIHSCGSSSWAYRDFIDMGIKAVDTLQPEAKDMHPQYLKDTFGKALAFHGCISTAGPIVTGTVEDAIQTCRDTLDIMMPNGGYCFAPTHSLQDNTPTDNVVAMYETTRYYGVY